MKTSFSKSSTKKRYHLIPQLRLNFNCKIYLFMQLKTGDGCIDIEEFTGVCTSFGISGDESRRAFEAISQV